MFVIELLKSVLYGIVEGITEWLPVSSTGHLILLNEWLPFSFTDNQELLAEFWEMFEVVIQLGAILAVIVLFWNRLFPFGKSKSSEEKSSIWQMWFKVVVASIPAAILGLAGDKLLEKLTGKDLNDWLYNGIVVAVALIIYGIAFIFLERLQKSEVLTESINDLTYAKAFGIGLFEMLSLIPGTSRSGSTILGARLLGTSRTVAAEFSFFMAIPVIIGASGIKMLGFFQYVLSGGVEVPTRAWTFLLFGSILSFAVSMIAIRFLMNFVKKHSFAPFGIYRILLGIFVLIYFLIK